MNKNLLTLIDNFLGRIRLAEEAFRTNTALENPFEWRSSGFPQTGTFGKNGEWKYWFHGIGCRVKFPSGETVDWDWGMGGRNDGFDLWRLKTFWKDNQEIQDLFGSEEEIEMHFDKAVKTCVISQNSESDYDTLYYLNDPKKRQPLAGENASRLTP